MPPERTADTAAGQPRLPRSLFTGTTMRVALAVVLGIAAILASHVHGALIPWRWAVNVLWLLPPAILVGRLAQRGALDGTQERQGARTPLLVLAALLGVFLCADGVAHPWFYFLNWVPPSLGDMAGLPYRLAGWVLLTALLMPFLMQRTRLVGLLLPALLIVMQVVAFQQLMHATGGRALSRDDHPSMMFRLWEISETWPQLLNYIPYWNAGAVHFTGVTTGLNGVGVILKPFLAFWTIERIYTPAIAVLFIVVVPWCAAFAVRLAGGNRRAAWIGGILAAGVSLRYFLWLLNFGTIGACFSTSFVLLFSCCVFRVLWLGRTERWLMLVLVASFVFLMMWPPMAIEVAATAVSALCCVRRWTRRKLLFLAGAAAIGLLLLYRRFGVLVFEGGDGFLQYLFRLPASGAAAAAATAPADGAAPVSGVLAGGWSKLVEEFRDENPVLVYLGVLGAVVFPLRSVRRWFVPSFVVLGAVAGWGAVLMPNLELHRMSIALAFLAVAPAALAIERILRTGRPRLAVLRAAVLALLVLTAFNVTRCFGGRMPQFGLSFLSERTDRLVAFIREHAPEGSRVLVAGHAVHMFGDGGHLAPIPMLSGREMMACDYYHFPLKMVEYNYPPRAFRGTDEAVRAYFDAYNVSLVLTKHGFWAKRLEAHPDQYRRLDAADDVLAFEVLRPAGSMFLLGQGTVAAHFNRLHVTTTDPRARTVIRYNWRDGLRADGPVRVRPYPTGVSYPLVEVEWNGASACTIEFASVW